MTKARLGALSRLAMAILMGVAWFPKALSGQGGHVHPKPPAQPSDSSRMNGMAEHAMSGAMDENMMKHMELTPLRTATHDDTVRALKVAAELRKAIEKYRDTSAATADGYKMFLPNVKNQRVYHFTNYSRALAAAFRFDASKPTSIIYRRGTDDKLHLVGGMYTMPKRASADRLDARIPLGIARWHKHVNWCLPKKGEQSRFLEKTRDGKPKFGPESPIATRVDCDAVNGEFYASPLGWMVHANVYDGQDLATVWGADHERSGKLHGTHGAP